MALARIRPQHLQRDEHKATADAKQTAEQTTEQTDRRKNGAAVYSGDRVGVSGWFITTE